MPSTKTRINLTVPSGMERALHRIAKREEMSVSAVALDLIRRALDVDEDATLLSVAEAREHDGAAAISHKRAWA